MKALIEQILTDESARDGSVDAAMVVAMSKKFAPWHQIAE
jgi:hypothetical protein